VKNRSLINEVQLAISAMMQSKLLMALFIVSAVILVSGAIQDSAIAFPQQKQGYSHHNKMVMQPGLYAFGTIASLQNDENDNPTWIVSGLWKGSISMDNKTQDNQSATAAAGSPTNATFYSKFNMVMTNGSALHKHAIYNFKLMNMSNPSNTTSVFNGTATITLKDGPVDNVPVSIKRIDNNVVSIWADPSRVNNHFGNTPIFGTIEKLLKVEK
jgi:hypothetical protein